jgi:hypothetical protein
MHNRAMDVRVINLLAAFAGAALAACFLAILTHDALGLPRMEIREVSLAAAVLLVIVYVAGGIFQRSK